MRRSRAKADEAGERAALKRTRLEEETLLQSNLRAEKWSRLKNQQELAAQNAHKVAAERRALL